MVTREQLESIEDTLSRIGLHVDGDWAIGGTVALCINDPSDVRIPLAHGYSGDIIVDSQTKLLHALEADPSTPAHPEATAMLNDPLGTAFVMSTVGAIGVAYAVHPDAQTVHDLHEGGGALHANDIQGLRSFLLSGAMQHRATVDGLTGQKTIVLTPGGVALTALASSIVVDSRLSQDPSMLFGTAVMAAEGAPDDVTQTLSSILGPLTQQVRMRVQRPHDVLAHAIEAMLEYAQADPMSRETALPALQAGTAAFMDAYARAREFGI